MTDSDRAKSGRGSKSLTRTTFAVNRALEYFSQRELIAQTGHEPSWWPEMLLKELIDNGLDACETAGVAPKIGVTIDGAGITVTDNGPGIPPQTIARACDYTMKVSDKAKYVSPTRGAQGNALKTVFAVPYVLDGKEGRVEISSRGKGYNVTVRTDEIRQEPRLELRNGRPPLVKRGTAVRITWPDSASSELVSDGAQFLQITRGFAFLNPHAAITIKCPQGTADYKPTNRAWRKWLPTNPTSPHWYSAEDLARLIASYIGHDEQAGRVRTVREFAAEFAGLSGSAKQKVVLESAGLTRADLTVFAGAGELDHELVGRLLEAMQRESRPIKAAVLGIIGEDHFRTRFAESGSTTETFRYVRKLGTTDEGLPYVVEAAFGYAPSGSNARELVAGVNWSPSIRGVPFDDLGDDWTLEALLQEQRCGRHEPIVMALHLARPKVNWQDRGKSKVSL